MAGAAGGPVTGRSIGDCAVCLDDILWSQDVRATKCGHVFHGPCIITCLTSQPHNGCPKCRVPCRRSQLVKLFGDDPIGATPAPTRRRVRESFATDMQSHLDSLTTQLEERDAVIQVLTQEKTEALRSKEALEGQLAAETQAKGVLQRALDKEKKETKRCKLEVSQLKSKATVLAVEMDVLKTENMGLKKSRFETEKKDKEIKRLKEEISRLSKSQKADMEKGQRGKKRKDAILPSSDDEVVEPSVLPRSNLGPSKRFNKDFNVDSSEDSDDELIHVFRGKTGAAAGSRPLITYSAKSKKTKTAPAKKAQDDSDIIVISDDENRRQETPEGTASVVPRNEAPMKIKMVGSLRFL